MSPETGVEGAEVTWRLSRYPGSVSAGIGLIGVGARINRELRDRPSPRAPASGMIPYASMGFMRIAYIFHPAVMASIGAGVQRWPARGGLYADAGAGVGCVWWNHELVTVPVVHLLIGHTFRP